MKQITYMKVISLSLEGFRGFGEKREFRFGDFNTVIGDAESGKTSIADAIAYAVTGAPYFGQRSLDRLQTGGASRLELSMRFEDQDGHTHEIVRRRHGNQTEIAFDMQPARQIDLTNMFGEKDVFLSILNPSYFIEVMKESGKELLQKYLPAVPHAEILSQLSGPVRECMESHEILSPEGYLKNCRSKLNDLTEQVIFLKGQKELAEKRQEESLNDLEQADARLRGLNRKVSELERKKSEGIDFDALEKKLSALIIQRDKAAKSDTTQASGLEDTIMGRQEQISRQKARQYESKFAEKLSQLNTELSVLQKDYQNELAAYRHVRTGVRCPLCKTRITEQNIGQIKENLAESVKEKNRKYALALTQYHELEQIDQKAKDKFEEFKGQDISKAVDELNVLLKKRKELSNRREALLNDLDRKIQECSVELEQGNLSEEEAQLLSCLQNEKLLCEEKIRTLESVTKDKPEDFTARIQDTERQIDEKRTEMSRAILYISKRSELLLKNLRMNRVKLALEEIVRSTGEVKPVFRFTYHDRGYDKPYGWLSNAQKIKAGLEICELVKKLTGRNYPTFIDNGESVTKIDNVRPTGQVFLARVVAGKPLQIEARAKKAAPPQEKAA